MARIHPSFPMHTPTRLGAHRERDILRVLEQGLDERFDVFHNLPWSGMQREQQSFGEYDFVIVSPGGQLLILEIKAGDVAESDGGLTKQYRSQGPKDIGHQMRRMHSSLLQRIENGDLPQVHVGALLVLPDHKIQGATGSYPPERVIEAIRAVVSSSCIALRFDRTSQSTSVTPQYLLMYLRSAEGQEQIRSLLVDAAMTHISVQSLLNSVRIPIPSADEIASVHEDFKNSTQFRLKSKCSQKIWSQFQSPAGLSN